MVLKRFHQGFPKYIRISLKMIILRILLYSIPCVCLSDKLCKASELMLINLAKFHAGSLKCAEGLYSSIIPNNNCNSKKSEIGTSYEKISKLFASSKTFLDSEGVQEISESSALLKVKVGNGPFKKMYDSNSISEIANHKLKFKLKEEEEEENRYLNCFSSNSNSNSNFKAEAYKNHHKNTKNDPILKFLNGFSFYLTFEEPWMNYLMHSFVKTNFPDVKDIYDEKIYDALELARIKFMLKEEVNYSSPLTAETEMISLIFYFIHELVYGIEELIPTSIHQWQSHFIQKLLKHAMPKSTEYYLKIVYESIDDRFNNKHFEVSEVSSKREVDSLKNQITNIVKFFGTNPNDWELLIFYKSNIESNLIFNHHGNELKMAVLQILHEILVPQEELQDFFIELVKSKSFSQVILDRLSDNWISWNDWEELNLSFKDIRLMRAMCKKLIPDDNNPIKYLWTRDSMNPFDLNCFLNLHKGTINSVLFIMDSENPSLTQIEIFTQIIRSRIYDFQSIQNYENSLILAICTKPPIFFKILINNLPTPFNMFIKIDHKYKHIFNYDLVPDKLEKIKIYLEYLKKEHKNPLPLLFIKIEYLRKLKPQIIDQFNLKTSYKFDQDHESYRSLSNRLNLNSWEIFRGLSLTFKEIIDFIDIEIKDFNLIEIFTSKPDDLDADYYYFEAPSISILKFLRKGVIEPVDERSCSIS